MDCTLVTKKINWPTNGWLAVNGHAEVNTLPPSQDPTGTTYPIVHVARTINQKGLDTINQPNVRPLYAGRFDQVLEMAWDSDAYLTTYQLYDEARQCIVPVFPRLNKTAYGAIQTIRANHIQIYSTLLVLDYDNDNHAAWTEVNKNLFQGRFERVCNAYPELMSSLSAIYYTKHGARFVWVLSEGVLVEQMEFVVIKIVNLLAMAGMKVDMLKDWCRLFLLPKVLRNDTRTEQQPYFGMNIFRDVINDPARCLDINKLISLPAYSLSLDNNSHFVAPQTSTALTCQEGAGDFEGSFSKPDPQEAQELLTETGSRGRTRHTDFFKAAKTLLATSSCYNAVFLGSGLPEGHRDQLLTRYVGEICQKLYGRDIEGVGLITPEHVYALLYPTILALRPDNETPDWSESLWGKVIRFWKTEQQKALTVAHEELQQHEEVMAALSVMHKGISVWAGDKFMALDAIGKEEFVRRHFFANIGKYYYALTPEGYYEDMPLSAEQLIPRLETVGLGAIIPTGKVNKYGDVIPASSSDIIRKYSTPVRRIELVPEIPGGFVEDLDGKCPVLKFPSFRRDPNLKAVYDEEVDKWLKEFFGYRYYEAGIKWIANAIAWDEGHICALSIRSAPGTGKGMLVAGLSEVLEYPEVCPSESFMGTFQHGMEKSPFIVVNEAFTIPRGSTSSAADKFKTLTGSSTHFVALKYAPPMTVICPYRVLFTANDRDIVQELTKGKTASPETLQALSERLLHMELGDGGQKHLARHGNHRLTSQPGRQWVKDPIGKHTDKIVASHFLWLYYNHPSRRDAERGTGRFLMTGSMHSEGRMFAEISIKENQYASLTVDIISMMVSEAVEALTQTTAHQKQITNKYPGLMVLSAGEQYYELWNNTKPGEIFLTIHQIIKVYREVEYFYKSGTILTESQTEKVLENLCIERVEHDGVFWYRLNKEQIIITLKNLGNRDRLAAIKKLG